MSIRNNPPLMKNNPLRDIFRLFFPQVCAACGRALPEGAGFVCNYCQWEIPLTGFWENRINPVAEKLSAHLPLENASSFYYFVLHSNFRNLIHDFKYRGRWSSALDMGRWFGAELAPLPPYSDIDLVIPVPLHIRKQIARGYNQSEYIARGIAQALGKPLDTRSVRRSRYNRSQTRRRKNERWENVEGIFSVRSPEALAGRHILLVDDVLTTGATLISCGEAILRNVPSARLSIVTLAVSKSELELVRKVY